MKSLRYIVIIIVIFFSGCSDWLELEPVGERFENNFYQTEEGIYLGLNSAYSLLQPKYYSGWSSYYFLANFPSDDSEVVGGGSGDRPEYHAVSNFSMLPTNSAIIQLWRRNYFGINRANVVIINADPEASLKSKEYIAEAKFLRAYYYAELVRFFGDIPLITTRLGVDEYHQPRVPAPAIYKQIIKDLEEAIPDLAVAPAENFRASKGAAYALLGKAYLYMASPLYQQKFNFELSASEYYQLAMNQFQEIYGSYSLEPNYDDIWQYEHENGIESIFEIEYANLSRGGAWDNGRVNGGNIDVQMCGPRALAADSLSSGWGFDMVTEDLVALYDAEGDTIRKNGTTYGEDFLNTISTKPDSWEKHDGYTGWFSKKRAPWKHLTYSDDPVWNYETNERVIRYGDVLLMMAEAAIGSGTGSPDVYLNEVRSRANLDIITGVTMADIKKERRLELAMEGFRFFDLVRWGDAPTALSDRGFVQGKHEVFPIPQEEIVNSGGKMTQNDNY